METRELLRKAVADFFEVDLSHVGPSFPLTGPVVHGSVRRATLASRIQHEVGLKSKAVYSAVTYGELEAELIPARLTACRHWRTNSASINGSGQIATKCKSPAPSLGSHVSCGIDMELIENLPPATDYWEDDFYRTYFTPAEIAYCLMQETPPLHFVARWCAKEALKKCDPDLFSEEMRNLELVSGESQEPMLNHYAGGQVRRLPHAVSISHTPLAAIAIVIKLRTEATQLVDSSTGVARTPGARTESTASPWRASSSRISIVPTLLAVVALGLAILALLRTYHLR